jgi:hypothetical protein
VRFYFQAVGGGGRLKLGRNFYRADPTEQFFMARTDFITGQNFPAEKAVFRARIGPTERGLMEIAGSRNKVYEIHMAHLVCCPV